MTLKEMRQSQVQIKYESQLEKRRSQRRTQGLFLQEILIRTVVWYLIHPLADDHQCWDIASRLTNAVLMVFTGS